MPRRHSPFLLVLLLLTACIAPPPEPDGGLLAGLTRLQPGRSRRSSSAHAHPLSNRDNKWIKPGQRHTLADLEGPGVITHIWLTFASPEPNWLSRKGSAHHGEVVLRIWWDDREEPAVETPLGDFFAAGFGRRAEVVSVPVVVQGGDAYNCWWRMPFRKRARIEVENQSARRLSALYYHVDWVELDSLPPDTAYFHARYNQAFPEKLGEEYRILETEGRGHYVGTVLSVRNRTPSWFGEGDEKFTIDGEKRPSVWGTGTEDYFLCAWGLDEFLCPYFGCTLRDGGMGKLGTRYCLYRWHLHDPVRFRKSLRFTIEHNGWVAADETVEGKTDSHFEREDDIASVAFWYQVGPPTGYRPLPSLARRTLPTLDQVISGDALLAGVRHAPGELIRQQGHPWSPGGQAFYKPRDEGAWFEFDFIVPPGPKRGLVLRLTRSYDYGRWRIKLDGRTVVESLDLYSQGTRVRDLQLDSTPLKPGRHTFRLECLGRNPASTHNWLGVDSVRLRRRWNKKRPNLHRLMREPLKGGR